MEMATRAKDFIKEKIGNKHIDVAVILGSGLGELADEFDQCVKIDYSDIRGFEKTNVQGHKGKLVFTMINDKNVLFMQGRFHFYEGYDIKKVVFPIKVFKLLNIPNLIITNAAGGLNTNFKPGTLMIINDHINFTGTNPLIGPNNDALGPRFSDMTDVYKPHLIQKALQTAKDLDIHVEQGVYVGVIGPSYETKAEVRLFRNFGADAVGMSTVNEAIFANYCSINVCGISCITNLACGLSDSKLDHKEVVQTALRVKENFKKLVKELILRM